MVDFLRNQEIFNLMHTKDFRDLWSIADFYAVTVAYDQDISDLVFAGAKLAEKANGQTIYEIEYSKELNLQFVDRIQSIKNKATENDEEPLVDDDLYEANDTEYDFVFYFVGPKERIMQKISELKDSAYKDDKTPKDIADEIE